MLRMTTSARLRACAANSSDDEFVEAVRKELRPGRKRGRIYAAVGVGLILLGAAWTLLAPRYVADALGRREGDVLVPAIRASMAVGAAAAVFVLMGVRMLSDARAARVQRRMAELLVARHDKLSADRKQTE